MRYKIIACDFDGTLYNDELIIPQKNIDTINEYKKEGGYFILATGRLFSSLKPHLDFMGIKEGKAICHQGAGIFDVATGKVENEILIPYDIAAKLTEFLSTKKNNIPIMFFNDNAYSYIIDEYVEIFAHLMNVPVHKVEEQLALHIKENKINCTKFLILVDENAIDQLIIDLRDEFGSFVSFNKSAESLIEAVNINASKGNALKMIADELGVNRENIMAIGDAENDISMVSFAGLGIAVENAMPSLKEVADVIVSSNDDCGVAEAIRKFALSGE